MKCAFCEWEKTAKKKKRATQDAVTIFFLWLRNFSQTLAVVKNNFGGGGNRTRVRRYSAESVYMLILFCNLILRHPKRMNTAEPALMEFAHRAQDKPGLLSCSSTFLEAPQESAKETACLLVRQQQADFLHFCFSTFLRGGWNLDMLPLPHYLRRYLFAPISQILIIFG